MLNTSLQRWGRKALGVDLNEAKMYKAKEPPQDKTNKMSCLLSKDSDLLSICPVQIRISNLPEDTFDHKSDKTFFMLNSTEHEIYPAHFNIKVQI